MRTHRFKQLFVIVLALAIITAQLTVGVSAMSSTPYGTLLQTFDEMTGIGSAYPNSTSVGICKADGTQTYTDASTSEAVNPLSIVSETGRGKVLRFRKAPATAQYGAHVIIGNTEGVGLSGISADTYYNAIISFDYKVDTAVCAGNGTLIKQFNLAADGGYYRYNWSLWNNATKSCDRLVSVNNYASAEEPESTYSAFKLIKDSEWHTYSFAVKLGTKDGGKKLGFVIDSPANDDIDFYLDNVSLTVIDVQSGLSGATVCLRSNGGAPMDLIGGIVGDPMTLPTPSKSDSVFDGWYSDAELTTPAGSVFVSNSTSFGTKENAITYYYAKLTEQTHDTVTDFDDYSSVGGSTDAAIGTNKPTYSDSNSITRTGVEILDLDDGVHGKVLHLSKKTSAEKYQPTLIIGKGSGQGISTTVSETCNVLVRFKYKVNESNSNSFYINRFHLTNQAQWPSSTGSGGFAGKSSYLSAETPEDYGSYKLICDNTWREVAVVIWNVPAHATVANGLSRIGFTFDTGKTAQCDLYIDDFSATRLSSGAAYSNICIHPDNGDVFDLTTAPVGSSTTLPILTKKEKEFGGWYLDSGLTTPLGSTIPAATDNWNSSGTLKVLNVYAKWQELSDTIIANFDSLSSV
ncbi:MAG: InlB B-repeat-containing protein, partial [Clostridia bacterium]|nr:InlB B-repeat-containing protein [Clostridia bacterium]